MMRIAKAFADLNWKVHVFATMKKTSLPLDWAYISCTRLHIIPEKGIFFYAKMNWRFFVIAVTSTSDYLLAVDADTLMGLRIASIIKNKPLIWDCHEIFTEMPELHYRPGVKRVWSFIEKIFTQKLSKVMCSTRGVADYLYTKRGIVAKVIHNYPSSYLVWTEMDKRFSSKLILFQGILNEGRFLEELIHTMKLLPEEFMLMIAGDGPLRPTLERIINQENLDSRIIITGMLTPEELRSKTTAACLGISLLNKNHLNSAVSLANKNLDYIMAGLPCITVNLPEYEAINKKWEVAILLEEVTPQTIAHAITSITSDFEKYREMYLACLEASKYLNWEKEVVKLNEFILSL
jgi:glycosyltransferase involved in cell wall biosynthesis